MRLLIFAHTPPPYHGQSHMVQLLLSGLGGEARSRTTGANVTPRSEAGPPPAPADIECYHVNCRFSDEVSEIGRFRWKKPLLLLKYCWQAIWHRFRNGVRYLYYVPAPGLRAAVYRDWMVMALCRPCFAKTILHWEAVGLGTWLAQEATPLERSITRRLLRRADLSIVLGEFYREEVASLDPKRVEVIYNGIPDPCPDYDAAIRPCRLARARARAEWLRQVPDRPPGVRQADQPGLFRVLYLSLCLREKGLFDTVEAVALANRKLTEERIPLRVHLTVAGEFFRDTERAEFHQRIAQPDLGGPLPVVTYCGFVAGEPKSRLFRDSDCFCLPTYYPAEGHPVALVEAMAFGLPIITSRWRAVPELFPDGYAGLVEPRSPEKIAALLAALLREPPDDTNRRLFLAHYTEARFVARFKAALQSLEFPATRTSLH